MSSWQEMFRQPTGLFRSSGAMIPGLGSPLPGIAPGLLEKVLEKTLGVGESTEDLDDATRAGLLNFARQHAGGEELSAALLADLVRTVLKRELARLAAQPGGNAICDQVAESIWDDPIARGRITNLWRLLQGETR